MPQANLLAKTQLDKFKAWLTAHGHTWRDGRGQYQVIQVQLAGQAGWHVIYYREHNPVHYSVPWPLGPAVQQFINDKKRSHGNRDSSAQRWSRNHPSNVSRRFQTEDRDPASWNEGDGADREEGSDPPW